ncbi:MAG: thiamine diphosphokinase [Lachnospiraceae bacterium]|nr:thiamine diphosphokinase [Lachnospiraceae bacterium]
MKNTKTALIVTGGTLNDELIISLIKNNNYDCLIACDSGISFFRRNNMTPDIVLGDYDSASSEDISFIKSLKDAEVLTFPSEKDETDTELGVMTAIERGAECIDIAGATGSRIDHTLGNIHILGKAVNAGVKASIIDANCKVTLLKAPGSVLIKKNEQYGRFVSLIPFAGAAEGVTLRGFKYPLNNAVLPPFASLGLSNEIEDGEGVVEIKEGYVLVIESKDK